MNVPTISSMVAALAVTSWACSGYIADTSVTPGDTVRVTAPASYNGVGTVAALENDALVVEDEVRADPVAVPLSSVQRLEVLRGKKSRIVAGALIGGGAGLALGVAAAASCEGHDTLCAGNNEYLIFALPAALLGLSLGALIGWIIQVDRWVEVPVDDVRVGYSPQPNEGATFSLTLRL